MFDDDSINNERTILIPTDSYEPTVNTSVSNKLWRVKEKKKELFRRFVREVNYSYLYGVLCKNTEE